MEEKGKTKSWSADLGRKYVVRAMMQRTQELQNESSSLAKTAQGVHR